MIDGPSVLNCYRVPYYVGKAVRHAIRRHIGVSHGAAHAIYKTAIGTMLVCVAAPPMWVAMTPSAPIASPIANVAPAFARIDAVPGVSGSPTPAFFSPLGDRGAIPPSSDFLGPPGSLFRTEGIIPPFQNETLSVSEPPALALFGLGVLALGALRSRRHAP